MSDVEKGVGENGRLAPLEREVGHRAKAVEAAKRGECGGLCAEGHAGDVMPVEVSDAWGQSFGWFAYCRNAQRKDAERGLTVMVLLPDGETMLLDRDGNRSIFDDVDA